MRFVPLAILLVAGGCSTAGRSSDPGRPADVRVVGAGGIRGSGMRVIPSHDVIYDTVHATVERIWPALSAVYAGFAIPLTTAEPRTLRIGNEGMKVRRRLGDTPLVQLLDCGRSQIGENADSYEIILSVVTTLHRVDARSTQISTIIEASGKSIQFAGAETRCRTKGELERQIALALRARLEG